MTVVNSASLSRKLSNVSNVSLVAEKSISNNGESSNILEQNGGFLQIKSKEEQPDLVEIDIWTTKIRARLSNLLINLLASSANDRFLKDNLPEDPINLSHLRRLVKTNNEEKDSEKIILDFAICSTKCVESHDSVANIMSSFQLPQQYPKLEFEKKKAPLYPPQTKQICLKWNSFIWPSLWRGNPLLIPIILSKDEISKMKFFLSKVVHMARTTSAPTHTNMDTTGNKSSDGNLKSEKDNPISRQECENNRNVDFQELSKYQCDDNSLKDHIPIATIVVDPTTNEILASSMDERKSSGNPLEHSIMKCLKKIADRELNHRNELNSKGIKLSKFQQGYLCLNLHIYTTHEPCTMCCMSMVHSRIGRLIYVKNMPRTGGIDPASGNGYTIHSNKSLNWSFQAWKWCADPTEFDTIPINPNINA